MLSGFSASSIFGKMGERWQSRTSYHKGFNFILLPSGIIETTLLVIIYIFISSWQSMLF